MKLKKKPHILIIGSGVLGAYLSKSLIGKKYNIIVTTRRVKKSFLNYKKLKIDKKVKFQKLDILNKKEIRKIINKYNPICIYYFAGQSSIDKSNKLSKNTTNSNYIGAKKFLEVLHKNKLNIKFFKSNTGYIFKGKNNKISLNSKITKPNNPYTLAQIKAYKLVKYYRKLGIQCYSIIFFNIESVLRPNEFLIKNICLAVKQKKKINVGNIDTIRDYSWAPEILKGVSLLYKIKPCDIIFASGRGISGRQIIKYLFSIKKLDYTKYININKNLFRKNETKIIVGSMKETLRKFKKFRWKPKIFGEKLLYKMYHSS